MAIDLNALREKHAQLAANAGGNAPKGDFLSNFLQLQTGTNVVRLLPGADDDTNFYAETKIHRVQINGQNRNVHCRKVHGEHCPLCDLYYGLWKTGNKEDETLARSIKPRARYYMNALDRENGGVKILSVGVILFNKIIATILDEDYGDITDPQNGFDFKIVKTMDGEYPKYDQSSARPKSTPAGSKAEVAEYMDALHDIHGLVKLEDYEDVKNIVEQITPVSMKAQPYSEPTGTDESDDDFERRMRT